MSCIYNSVQTRVNICSFTIGREICTDLRTAPIRARCTCLKLMPSRISCEDSGAARRKAEQERRLTIHSAPTKRFKPAFAMILLIVCKTIQRACQDPTNCFQT